MISSRTIVILGALLLAPSAAHADGKGKITVQVNGFRSDTGVMRFALFAAPKGFPGKHQLAIRSGTRPISGRAASFQIEGVAHGTYAIAVLHDANGNGKMDTNWIGIPTEGGGASRDPRARFGPPSFSDAKFVLRDPVLGLSIRIQYP